MSAASRIVAGVIAVAAGTGVAMADVLYDTLWITDALAYDTGYSNAYSGLKQLGILYDAWIVDDFVVNAAVYPDGVLLTRLAQDSLCFFGEGPRDGFKIRIFDDHDGMPGGSPWVGFIPASDATVAYFSDPVFGLYGLRFDVDATSLGITLAPATYWIGIQPVDTTADGDWYYQVADEDALIGGPIHYLGYDEWATLEGTVAMRIDAVPIPAPWTAAALVVLAVRRRR